MIPASKPKIALQEALLSVKPYPKPTEVLVIGFRGYYLSMGKKGQNDRGIYDDAIVVIGPEHYSTYNANCDPSAFRPRIATLKPGTWLYKPGIHGLSKPKHLRYAAFVQAGPVTVQRDGAADETGWFGINIHRGAPNSTSSLGCQTIPPQQWPAFQATLMDQLKRAGQATFRYVLQ